MAINTVTISGNIGREPEMRQTSGGMAVLGFSMAVNERRKNNQGGWDDYTNWIDVSIFGNRAQGLAPHLHKGMKLTVKGKLRYNKWEKDGQTRFKLEVIGEDVDFMSPRSDGSQQNQQQGQQPSQEATYVEATYIDDDDIPF